jgi:hypothetical protein
MSYEPTRPLPSGWQSQPQPQDYPVAPVARRRRRRRRWPLVSGILLVILAVLLVVADRVACAITENQMASQIQQSGFPVKPHVSIEGFPFLTQLAAKDFNHVVVTASNVPEGPLTISSVSVNLLGMHISSFSSSASATIDTLNGTALITFGELASAGDVPSGITFGPDPGSSNAVNANISILGFSDTVTAQLIRLSTDEFRVQFTNLGGIPASILGNLASFDVTVPKLPAGLTIQSVSVTQQGVQITVSARNTTLSQ